jgi:hypothetical protein
MLGTRTSSGRRRVAETPGLRGGSDSRGRGLCRRGCPERAYAVHTPLLARRQAPSKLRRLLLSPRMSSGVSADDVAPTWAKLSSAGRPQHRSSQPLPDRSSTAAQASRPRVSSRSLLSVEHRERRRSQWRPNACPAAGGASRDGVGLLTPALLLRQEAGTGLRPILASGVDEEQALRGAASEPSSRRSLIVRSGHEISDYRSYSSRRGSRRGVQRRRAYSAPRLIVSAGRSASPS